MNWPKLVESGIFLVTQNQNSRFGTIPFAGIKSRCSPVSHPLANLLGCTCLDETNVDQTIQQVIAYFAQRQEAFSWRVGPISQPEDLGARLAAAGMSPGITLRAMVLDPLTISEPLIPGIRVRQAGPDDVQLVSDVMARAYPVQPELAYELSQGYLHISASHVVKVYLAFSDYPGMPVGLGVIYDFPNRDSAVLAGAGVVPEARNEGVYRTLLAHRLQNARERGIGSVVVQAVEDTSAPICLRAGFRDLGAIKAYHWFPETDTSN